MARPEPATSPDGRGRYELRERLAEGGMGVIYRAHDRLLGREVAYKRLRDGSHGQRLRTSALFQSEFNTLAQLVHPRIVDVYEYGLDSEGPYYTMELLDGADLASCAPLPLREACRVVRDVASALGLLHARKLIHRDVTPVNVRVLPTGRAKLLDFGALAQFGAQSQVVGTPAFVAPEAVSGAALDQRVDLYALGALLYFALTGVTAIRARTIEQAQLAWQEAIVPASELAAVPAALDALITALLQPDPVARPQNVAYVLERLDAIAQLSEDPREDAEIARGYLSHPPLVGRGEAVAALELDLRAAAGGHGATLTVEGLHGMGRSALLEHTELHAQLLGATVLRVTGGQDRGPLGTTRALLRGALLADPDLLEALRSEHEQAIAYCLNELHEPRTPDVKRVVPTQASERQAGLAASILDCLRAVSRRNPLVLLIDDAQRADGESLGLLASLAQDVATLPLAIVITCATDESAVDSTTLRQLSARGQRLTLARLGPDDMFELTATLFGGAPNSLRLSLWLHDVAQGHPLYAMALAQQLLQRGLVRYRAGIFTLPHDVSADFGEVDLGHVLLARLDGLSANARLVAEMLSVEEDVLPLDELLAMVALDEASVRLALQELSDQGVLEPSRHRIGFVHRALRVAVEGSLGDDVKRALHRTAAAKLLSRPALPPMLRVQAGMHLLHAGDEAQGAEQVADSAIELAYTAEGTGKVTAPLELALAVFKNQGRSDKDCIRVLTTLTVAGFYGDARLSTRYFHRTYRTLLELTGTKLAARLRPLLGPRLALGIGLLAGFISHAVSRRKRRIPTFKQMLSGLFGVAAAGSAALASAYEAALSASIAKELAPFDVLGPSSAAVATSELCSALADSVTGFPARSQRRSQSLHRLLVQPGAVRGLEDEVRRQMLLGCYYMDGLVGVLDGGQTALHCAARLESEAREFYKPRAELLRVLHYGFRGEQDLADQHRVQAERLSLLGGNAWSALTAMATRTLVIAYWTEDAVALARVRDDLSHVIEQAPTMRDLKQVAEALLAHLAGNSEQALVIHERSLRVVRAYPLTVAPLQHAHLARVLCALGRAQQARELCREQLATRTVENDRLHFLYAPLRMQLALSEAHLGNTAVAAEMLDALLAELAELDNPLLRGSLHRDRAKVALIAQDLSGFDAQLARMNELFRQTRNPCLVRQCDELAALAVRTGLHAAPISLRAARSSGAGAGTEDDVFETELIDS
jgi:tRNA A-37 threonylcarbamoyl transferase component Bud32